MISSLNPATRSGGDSVHVSNKKMTLPFTLTPVCRWPILVLTLAFGCVLSVFAQDISQNEFESLESEHTLQGLLPDTIPDPFEPANRSIGIVNHGVMMGVIRPTSAVYRFVVIPPLRTGVSNFSHNLAFPVRLLNNLLQGKWEGAGVESKRFVLNSTMGLGGLFDLATREGIGRSNESFQRTLASWGWEHHAFVMVPFTGPSSDRGIVGGVVDRFANPSTYMTPLPYLITYNSLAQNMLLYEQFTASEADPYYFGKQAWAYISDQDSDLEFDFVHEEDASTQTLESIRLSPHNSKFNNRRSTVSVQVPTTGKRLRYTYWMQVNPAPIVYLLPGLGGHRRSNTSSALAEMFYESGFSVATVSSIYNPEYISKGSPVPLPGHTRVDTEGLLRVLTRMDRQMKIDHPNQITSTILSGVSMGGFHTLILAANETFAREEGLLLFDHYLAIHAPVDLLHGMQQLDLYFTEPLAWPASERRSRIQHTMGKTLVVSQSPRFREGPLPYTIQEARYLIGLSFKLVLRDMIYATQRRENLGILQEKIRYFDREDIYNEILGYSYMDYFNQFLMKYYSENQAELSHDWEKDLLSYASLRSFEGVLKNKGNVDLFVNRNDFLISDEDFDWLKTSIPDGQLHFFDEGGHLGNLWKAEVRAQIVSSLSHLLEQ